MLCAIFEVFLLAVFGRVILSWFPLQPGGALAQIFSFLYTVTEPVLGPVRRVVPPIGGGLDLSPLIVLLGIQIIAGAVFGCRLGF